jgi:hypothetical protein
MSAGRTLAAEGRAARTGGGKAAHSMSGNRTPTAKGRAAHADMADAAERPSDHYCLDYFATNSAEHLTFDVRGKVRLAALCPLDGGVRRQDHAGLDR